MRDVVGFESPPRHAVQNKGVTGFDLAWKIKQQSVVVGSTLKADKTINADEEITAAMANFDAEIEAILDDASVLV